MEEGENTDYGLIKKIINIEKSPPNRGVEEKRRFFVLFVCKTFVGGH